MEDMMTTQKTRQYWVSWFGDMAENRLSPPQEAEAKQVLALALDYERLQVRHDEALGACKLAKFWLGDKREDTGPWYDAINGVIEELDKVISHNSRLHIGSVGTAGSEGECVV